MNPQGVYVQKPKWDIYTTMLLIALTAIIIAIVVLILEMKAYNFDWKANEATLQQAAVEYVVPASPAIWA
jgi:heme/copper-type cytochrome/quinol oxidase subunit 2